MISRAPMRISFGGGGTDLYPYRNEMGGCSLGVAIKKYATASFGGKSNESPLVLAIKDRLSCFETISVSSDSLPFSGLGASGSVAVAVVGLISQGRMSKDEIAQLAFEIERNDLGIKGGAQDQWWASHGGFSYIEFCDKEVHVLPMVRGGFLDELEKRILLVHTGSRTEGLMIHEDEARRTVENMHILDRIKELANEQRRMLRKENLFGFSELLDISWEEKKNLSPFVSTPEIDAMYEEIKHNGALAGKLAGAGGGGYFMVLCENVPQVIACLNKMNYPCERIQFDWEGLVVNKLGAVSNTI